MPEGKVWDVSHGFTERFLLVAEGQRREVQPLLHRGLPQAGDQEAEPFGKECLETLLSLQRFARIPGAESCWSWQRTFNVYGAILLTTTTVFTDKKPSSCYLIARFVLPTGSTSVTPRIADG